MNSLFALSKLFLEQHEKHKRFVYQHFSIFYLHLLFSIWAMHSSWAFYPRPPNQTKLGFLNKEELLI